VNFLVDRCAGAKLAEWLRNQGHDVREVRGPDPGDEELLRLATSEQRVLITIDTDFGTLVFLGEADHAGIVRLSDVPARRRIELMQHILESHPDALAKHALITVRGGTIRVRWKGTRTE
jgi:predicted nuclease of predicted toxin-antitoxin system